MSWRVLLGTSQRPTYLTSNENPRLPRNRASIRIIVPHFSLEHLPHQLVITSTESAGLLAQRFSPKVGHLHLRSKATFILEGSAYKTPACYYGFASFAFTISIMFTSHSIMFALFSFLAGTNACLQCPVTIAHDGGVMHIYNMIALDNQTTLCIYDDDQNGHYSIVNCLYETVSVFWMLCNSLFSVEMLAIISG
ncbi:uncharacterized protein EDB91DRAFT_337396 [Suillus paluster]|uniref:uncharacterized protein n=1 Tax=Suillus paluster TaxID=48578 RepID=UPI001B8755F5|nr:uncharacterized protein EDB91DRAFT_337396 [Suillus paluster]KAG1720351.1 hypothetical protein EDB91DRAFT_337396 [Suillus paluster]